jgi:asparagine synthase (glutamine-hydrolysing)
MCGIAGFVERSGAPADPARLRRMTDSIAHRGPDDEAQTALGPVGLGHRRLSIVDVSEFGRQPMCDVLAQPAAWISFNGEIYNFKHIRDGLPPGEPFRGTSDTEVLLRALRERSAAVIPDLNGIFAFAFLDVRRREMLLARDHFGIKPLYFAQDQERFYFASEIKAILAAGFRPELSELAVLDFVFTGWTSDERTMFRGIQRLPPGSLLRYSLASGQFRVERYYTPAPDWEAAAALGDSEEAWTARIARALEDSVRGQLMSDVPVGTFCSGGIDSSLVTALAARHKPDIMAFNVACPDDPGLDEGKYAQHVAAHVGVRLLTFELDRASFRRALVRTVEVTEYPLSFVNTVPLGLISQLARDQGVKVLLSGEGADECFGGYVGQYKANALERVARSKGALGHALFSRGISLAARAGAKVGMRASAGRAAAMHDCLTGGLRNWDTLRKSRAAFERFQDPLDRELAAELLTQLQSYLLPILHRTDRASMAASVEARVPFLDPRLVGLAMAVPPRLKVGVSGLKPVPKKILKRIAEAHLPHDIVYRPKMGFMVPPAYYVGPWPEPWLHEGFIASAFGIDPAQLRAWIAEQQDQTAAWMLTLEIWGQIFMQGRSAGAIADDYLALP